MTVSVSLCHSWGTLNIPRGLTETELVLTVSECKCGESEGLKRSPPDDLNGNGYFTCACAGQGWVSRQTSTRSLVPLSLPSTFPTNGEHSTGDAIKMGGYGFTLHAPCAGQDPVSRQVSSKSTCCCALYSTPLLV